MAQRELFGMEPTKEMLERAEAAAVAKAQVAKAEAEKK